MERSSSLSDGRSVSSCKGFRVGHRLWIRRCGSGAWRTPTTAGDARRPTRSQRPGRRQVNRGHRQSLPSVIHGPEPQADLDRLLRNHIDIGNSEFLANTRDDLIVPGRNVGDEEASARVRE